MTGINPILEKQKIIRQRVEEAREREDKCTSLRAHLTLEYLIKKSQLLH